MAMSSSSTTPIRNNALLSHLKAALLTLQRATHTLVEEGRQCQLYSDVGSDSMLDPGQIECSKWRKVDSRTLGVKLSMISSPSWTVLNILRNRGFEAYLVGGCVRDLLLNRIPKDFDVITTAALKQISKQFHHAQIVGQRFPICRVHVKGSVVEVSSFETVAQHAKDKEKSLSTQMPRGCDKKDFIRWRNCMHRDFTINSLFFDPFVNKIYDYANGMVDLRSLKVRTLIPAQLSFKEDCARILRGMRITARLNFSFSKETEAAIRKLSSSIVSLAKSRIMMELDYMLSYGAAEPSLRILGRYNLLDILLPVHAAYLAQQNSKQSGQQSIMLPKLFFNLDKLFTCDRPSDSSMWVGLLAFHLALVSNPQPALVILTLASVLYHGEWKEGVKFARQHAQAPLCFVPEISEACDFISDDELAERVTQLALLVRSCIDVLTDSDILLETMARFPDFPCSGLVFVPMKRGQRVAELFNVLVNDVESYKKGRDCFEINYSLLGKGNLCETRFVLGKIVLDTITSIMDSRDVQRVEVVQEVNNLHKIDAEEKVKTFGEKSRAPIHLKKCHAVGKDEKKHRISPSNSELHQGSPKKQKLTEKKSKRLEESMSKNQLAYVNKKAEEKAKESKELIFNNKCQKGAKKNQKMVSKENFCISQDYVTKRQEKVELCRISQDETIMMQENVTEKEDFQLQKHKERTEKGSEVVEKVKCHKVSKKQQKSVEMHHSSQNNRIEQQKGVLENKNHDLHQPRMLTAKNDKNKQVTIEKKSSRPRLSNLFK